MARTSFGFLDGGCDFCWAGLPAALSDRNRKTSRGEHRLDFFMDVVVDKAPRSLPWPRGTVTLKFSQTLHRLVEIVRLREDHVLQDRLVGDESVRCSHPLYRRIQVFK